MHIVFSLRWLLLNMSAEGLQITAGVGKLLERLEDVSGWRATLASNKGPVRPVDSSFT